MNSHRRKLTLAEMRALNLHRDTRKTPMDKLIPAVKGMTGKVVPATRFEEYREKDRYTLPIVVGIAVCLVCLGFFLLPQGAKEVITSFLPRVE